MGQGIQLSLLPLFARTLGWTDAEIGVTGAMYYFGFVVGCLMASRMLSRSGHIRVFLTLAGASAACLLILEISSQYWLWLVLRFSIGWCLAGVYVTSESWLNEHTSNASRGKVLSFYVLVSLVGIGLGQQLLSIVPFDVLFRVGAAIMLVSLLPLGLFATDHTMILKSTSLNLRMLNDIPVVASAGIFLSGIVTGSLWMMAPLAGDAKELSTAMIGTMMNAVVLGGALFQYPLGAMSDLIGRTRLIAAVAICCSLNALFVLAMPPLGQTGLMLVMFVFGGTSLTVYAVCAAEAHDKSSSSRTEISALLLLLNGIGSMIGPIITGVISTYAQESLFVVALLSMLGLVGVISIQSGSFFRTGKDPDCASHANISENIHELKVLNGIDETKTGFEVVRLSAEKEIGTAVGARAGNRAA